MARAIYAVRYAHREAVRRTDNFYGGDPHDAPMPMAYYVWAIVDADRTIVVDTGFTPETAARRPGRELTADVAEALGALGVAVDRVEDVVLTHLHYDHAGATRTFPRARFWVQDREMAFWTGRHAGRPAFVHSVEPGDVETMVRLNFAGRLRFVDGDAEIAPGVSLHRVGGHAAGLQVVRVETDDGVVVLASDAAHYYENLDEDRPFSTVHSLEGMYDAFDALRRLAGPDGEIVPGHDPLVLERHPPASPALAGTAVVLGRTADDRPSPGRRIDAADPGTGALPH
jgi:glyoxylase-like metal-dependent hydrolase (beta-lactamase superfamily II)